MSQRLDEDTLRSWMQKLGPRLIALSASICRDRHQAESIVQEAFIKLWKKPPDAGEIAYTSWLRRVVTNLSINALQRTKRPAALPRFSADPAMHSLDGGPRRAELAEELERVQDALDRLDDTKRSILMLRAFGQMSYEEIADHLGIPVGTVMSRLNRARTALLEELKREMKHPEDEPMVFEFKRYRQA
jgi:RNA polymerase sigma-70 factor (ECF subfamily)